MENESFFELMSLLTRVFSIQRFQISELKHKEICLILIKYLNIFLENSKFNKTQFKIDLEKLIDLSRVNTDLNSLLGEKDSVRKIPFAQEKMYVEYISKILKYESILFEKVKLEELYDLIDLIHAFPDSILSKRWDSKAYFKSFIKPFNKKWKEEIMWPFPK